MGSRILAGRYELIEKIGEGGMAVVFKSRDRLLDRYVAIKILRPEYTRDESFIEGFRKESQVAANLVHPNIVNVYDVGKEGNIYYIVMELITGQPLSDIIKKEAPLDPRRAVTIAKQVASALSMAHSHQLIHRDVKPHNILITDDGVAKISDFGIAKAVTKESIVDGEESREAVMGSVHYFSPEQARGAYVDEKSDIYSLGIVLFEMLTGQVPFDGDTAVAVALKHMNEPITPPTQINPEIPEDLEEIIMKATSKLQVNRYKNADEMITALNFVKFSRFTDPDAAVAAAKEHGHTQDTLTQIDMEQTAAVEKDVKAEMQERKEKRIQENRAKNRKKRIRRRIFKLIFWLLILGALVYGVLWAIEKIEYMKGVIFNENELYVPKVIGMDYEYAEEQIKAMNLTLRVDSTVKNPDYKAGEIINQNPAEGTKIKSGGQISVSIAEGSGFSGEVPSVKDKTLAGAQHIIEDAKYVCMINEEYSDTVVKGFVISQNPAAGTSLEEGSTVTIVVSKGSENGGETSLNLVGKTLDEAKAAIEENGYVLGAVNTVENSSVAENTVISHNPGPGTTLEPGQMIDLVVSSKDGGSSSSSKYQTKSVVLPVDLSGASSETFYLTVNVSDSEGDPRTPISKKEASRSEGQVSITVEGQGPEGLVYIFFDNNIAFTYAVDFEAGTYQLK